MGSNAVVGIGCAADGVPFQHVLDEDVQCCFQVTCWGEVGGAIHGRERRVGPPFTGLNLLPTCPKKECGAPANQNDVRGTPVTVVKEWRRSQRMG